MGSLTANMSYNERHDILFENRFNNCNEGHTLYLPIFSNSITTAIGKQLCISWTRGFPKAILSLAQMIR